MLVVHAVVPIDDDSREQALEMAADLAAQSRSESGVIEYRVTTDIEAPTQIRVFEKYEDETAFHEHLGTDHFQAFAAALPEHLAGEPSITRYDVASETDVDL
jgi:quinol monooxygenase YgiN